MEKEYKEDEMIKKYIKNEIEMYKKTIAKEITARGKTTAYNLKALSDLYEILDNLSEEKSYKLDYIKLASSLKNEDGTSSPKWTLEETTSVANDYDVEMTHISKLDWYLTLNMIYSDYCEIAKKYNLDMPEFYVDIAKQFLFDSDSKNGTEKLELYFCYIK